MFSIYLWPDSFERVVVLQSERYRFDSSFVLSQVNVPLDEALTDPLYENQFVVLTCFCGTEHFKIAQKMIGVGL